MIILQDVVARFLCLALEENLHSETYYKTALKTKTTLKSFKNWGSLLQFEGD